MPIAFASHALLSALLQVQAPLHLVAPLPRRPLPKPAAHAVAASASQNRLAAGVQNGRVLSLAIDVVTAKWKPEGENDPEVPVLAFAEVGKSATVPGPLIRVRRGTEVQLTLSNRSDSALVIGGLRAGSNAGDDTVQLAVGATRQVRVRLDSTGTYFYWGAFKGTTASDRNWLDSQLNGAIVVDAPTARTDDHIFVLSEWFHPYDDRRQAFEVVSVINGKGFPHTERVVLPQGDSVRFRIINTMALQHPMHLHGFYYRIEEHAGKRIPPSRQLLSNTDLLEAGTTEVFSFLPSTPGNWLLHCHFAFHVDETVSLAELPSMADTHHARDAMAPHSMRGLAVALQVTPAPGYQPPSMVNARTIHLQVQREPNALPGGTDAIGFIEQVGDSVPPAHKVSIPGPVLELQRGTPVRIVVRNQLDQPTSVHWHGLEIESFPDGVPNWSGLGDRVYTQIAPRDSFVAEFVPPRAGTFPYHSHLNDRQQMLSGMYGAIIVTDRPRDLAHDHLVVVGGGGPAIEDKIESPFALVNGRTSPRSLHLTAGETHRFRLVSINPDWPVRFTLRNDAVTARWRAVAKDGADLPPAMATTRLARVVMGPGETADFEFTPAVPGTWRLDVASDGSGWQIPLSVIVEAKPRPTTKTKAATTSKE
ncbi:multicopper oxidase domain-containing protein [Gemmatimonas sp.]|uniref:multicopper oxidase domain-containing protein n=1 Tax=Gemmatimonas sp. TaxID=1962908 RepID=UPI003983302C